MNDHPTFGTYADNAAILDVALDDLAELERLIRALAKCELDLDTQIQFVPLVYAARKYLKDRGLKE